MPKSTKSGKSTKSRKSNRSTKSKKSIKSNKNIKSNKSIKSKNTNSKRSISNKKNNNNKPTLLNYANRNVVNNRKKNINYTDQTIKSKLNGYIDIPRNQWDNIPKTSHIRYKRVNGTWCSGGFVSNVWTAKNGKKGFTLERGRKGRKGYLKWYIYFNNMTRIFKKVSYIAALEINYISKDMEKLYKTHQQSNIDMNNKIKKLENQNKMLMSYIQSLNNKMNEQKESLKRKDKKIEILFNAVQKINNKIRN